MANTITNLIPIVYAALDQVSREMVGMVGAVGRDSRADTVAVGQSLNIPVVGAITADNITPGTSPASDGDAAPGNVALQITKSRYAPVRWNGEETLAVNQTNIMANVNTQRFAQAMRTLVNEVESDLAALYATGSRAYGTAGTTPFASTLGDSAQMLKLLQDNGAPTSDLQLVLGTSASANLRSLAQLTKANEAATEDTLRRGVLLDMHGFAVRESGQVKSHTKGTGTSYTSSTAGFAVGETSIAIITGSGTVVAGDVVTFAGDTNKYLVTTGVSAPGTIVIAAPGLKVALAASAVAMTIGNSYTANMAFSRSSMVLATRSPAMPEGGDAADDVFTVTDPVSNLAFQIAKYRQYRQVKFEVSLAWGVKTIAPRHIGVLLG